MLNSSFIIDLFSELNVEASNADKFLGLGSLDFFGYLKVKRLRATN